MLDIKRTSAGFGVLGRIQPASDKADIYSGDAVRVTTPPERWAYAARIPRESYWHGQRAGGAIYMRMHVVQGEVGIGVHNGDNSAFLVERYFAATRSPQVATVAIPLHDVGDLIIRNAAAEGRSRVILYQISVVPCHAGNPHFAELER